MSLRNTASKRVFILASFIALAVLVLSGTPAFAQQVTYYDFDVPFGPPSQASQQCSPSSAPAGTLFCFNDGTGQNASPSFLMDTYPGIIDPNPLNNPGQSSSHYAIQMTGPQLSQQSSTWFAVPQKISNGFTAYFAVKFTPNPNAFATADGVAFVIQNSAGGGNMSGCPEAGSGLSVVGGNGGCIGYGGIDNSVAFELDTYRNFWDPNDTGDPNNDNHVAIMNCGAGLPNSPDHTSGCQVSLNVNGQSVPAIIDPPGVTLADGNVHQVVIEYSGPNEATPYLLRVYVDPPFVPGTHTPASTAGLVLSGVYNIGANVNLLNSGSANDSAYVGFTSSTGGGDEQHEVMAWTFTPHTPSTQQQPISPPGTQTTFPFGSHTYGVTYPPDAPAPPPGINIQITATPITPQLFAQLVSGGPFAGSQCQVYDDTGGQCIVYSASCIDTSSNTYVQCPTTTPTDPILMKTAFDNTVQPISPGFIQGDPFYSPVASITGNGTAATVTCAGDCSVTQGQTVKVLSDTVAGFNATVTVLSASATTPNMFTFASTVQGTGTGGYLTSTNVQNIFYQYFTQRIDGSVTGRSKNFGSDFIATSLTAGPTMLSVLAPSVPYGTPGVVTVTATSVNGAPTGSILLSVDKQPAVSQALSSGVAVFTLSGLAPGTHTLAVSYPQNASFPAGMTSGTLVVTKAVPTASVTGLPSTPAPYQSTYPITASSNTTSTPTLYASGSCTLSNGVVTITYSVGTCKVTANWPATVDYAAIMASQTTTLTTAQTTITVTSDTPNPANLATPVSIGFTVSTPNGVATSGKYTITSNVPGDPSCTASLTANGTGSCLLSFPTPGARTVTISYAGCILDSPTSTQFVQNVTGAPVATVYPTSLSFGSLNQGVVSTKVLVLTNTGSVGMAISTPTFTNVTGSTPPNFSAINECPASLDPGASCSIDVVFVAGPASTTQSANLVIASNAANASVSVPLSGTVLASPLSFSPIPVAFGTVAVNSSTPTNVTLTNNTTSTLSLTTISMVGAASNQFIQTNNCGKSLAANSSCNVTVNFNPTQTGASAAYLRVITTVGQGFAQVLVNGTAE
jgi:Bacterial lectin/Abnormal spindle-like microcephaly-assoc'd, ASPM-SPD-2-Hydin